MNFQRVKVLKLLLQSITFIFTATIFYSCSKEISGTVRDNFGNPIADVSVSIPNSDFKTTTNSSGEFKLNYAPGKFKVEFEKAGHSADFKELEVTQKVNYPLQLVELTRIPSTKGVFVKGEKDYIELSMVKLKSKRTTRDSFWGSGSVTSKRYFFEDDLAIVEVVADSVKSFEVFNNTKYALRCIQLLDNTVCIEESSMLSSSLKANYVKSTSNFIAEELDVQTFNVKDGKIYALIRYSDSLYGESATGDAYLLKIKGK